ncbi:hypothetical protein PR003_g34912 [Phytophthora rubi]|uniref:Uncharacterized protein n=1 Tax=Phytophthora rubi TaxID=129364 RepID=A0A6A3G3V8_9STRA|nr:hypothetical protein PR001_g33714 [Phytophthora rubi]KAE9259148.1 hypothetical protein PR003_g34912 [Phytophthora rubi]
MDGDDEDDLWLVQALAVLLQARRVVACAQVVL